MCWNFPNCFGRIDGMHIRIKCLLNPGSQYFNYKQYHSIVLQAVVDANRKFVTVDVGAYGNNNNIYLLQLGCHPVAVVILHVNKT